MSHEHDPDEELPPSGKLDLPKLDFATFVMSILGSALVHLGDAPDPETGKAVEPNLLLARQDIDLLALLAEKTKGNLHGEEERVLNQGLYDVRMRYIEVQGSLAQQAGPPNREAITKARA